MSSYKVIKSKDSKSLAKDASELIASYIVDVLKKKERCQIALSGGSTPSLTYKLLGNIQIPWKNVDVFLGDERWVEPTDNSSNTLMLNQTLFSSYPGSEATFHPVPIVGCLSPEDSAKAFADVLKENCIGNPPVFDLIVLGLGIDGHTASLFPSTNVLNLTDRWVGTSEGNQLDRITLTAPVLSSARQIFFLVSGNSKQLALRRLLDPLEPFERTPARLAMPGSEILVLVDEDACGLL